MVGVACKDRGARSHSGAQACSLSTWAVVGGDNAAPPPDNQRVPSRRASPQKSRRAGGTRNAESEWKARLTHLEATVVDLRHMLEMQAKRIAALQAHLDHVAATFRGV